MDVVNLSFSDDDEETSDVDNLLVNGSLSFFMEHVMCISTSPDG